MGKYMKKVAVNVNATEMVEQSNQPSPMELNERELKAAMSPKGSPPLVSTDTADAPVVLQQREFHASKTTRRSSDGDAHTPGPLATTTRKRRSSDGDAALPGESHPVSNNSGLDSADDEEDFASVLQTSIMDRPGAYAMGDSSFSESLELLAASGSLDGSSKDVLNLPVEALEAQLVTSSCTEEAEQLRAQIRRQEKQIQRMKQKLAGREIVKAQPMLPEHPKEPPMSHQERIAMSVLLTGNSDFLESSRSCDAGNIAGSRCGCIIQ